MKAFAFCVAALALIAACTLQGCGGGGDTLASIDASCPTSSHLTWPTTDCRCFFGHLSGVMSIVDACGANCAVPNPNGIMVHYSSESGPLCPIPKAIATGFQGCSPYIKVTYSMCTLLKNIKADTFYKSDVIDSTQFGPMWGVVIGCEANVTKIETYYYGNQTFTKPPTEGGEEPQECGPVSALTVVSNEENE